MFFSRLNNLKSVKRCFYIALAFSMLVALVSLTYFAFAAGTLTGTVNVSDSLNVRSEPNTSSGVIGSFRGGDTVTILNTVNDSTGATDSSGNIYRWYQVQYGNSTGYVRSDYIINVTESGGGSESNTYYGVISSLNTNVNFRSGPGTSYDKIGELTDCQIVSVHGSSVSGWYNITTEDGTTGYVSGSYIIVSSTPVGSVGTDADFEAYIAQYFPASYHQKLRALHVLYPNWNFVAYDAGSWSEAVAAESKLGVSLVSSGALSSWKGTIPGAYNWETGVWTGLDGSSWVQASQAVVEYFLDPRNFLGPDTIFQFLYQGFDGSVQTMDGLRSIISNSFLSNDSVDTDEDSSNGTTTYADAIYTAGQTNGINPYVLAAMIIQEVGRDGSDSISGTVPGYEGYYNFYNIGAYDTGNMTAIQRGLWYAKGGNDGATSYGRPWNTRYRSIVGGAQFYADGYISNGQNTLYTKRFNVAPVSGNKYTHQYMTNVGGAASEGYILSDAYSASMRTTQLQFYIPVYSDMPEQAVSMPTGDGSPNNRLSSLSVDGFGLTPSFNYDTTEYSLVVPNSISSVTISASPFDSTASINVNGAGLSDGRVGVELSIGNNTVDVNVTAQNGDVRTYRITIARQGPVTSDSVSSDKYVISDGKITRIEPQTSVGEFLSGMNLKDGAYITVTSSINVVRLETEAVGTGDVITVYNADGSVQTMFYAVIYGEVNGDGAISNSDLIRVRNHILGTSSLQGNFATAADVTKDGSISNSDLIRVRNHILGTSKITQ